MSDKRSTMHRKRMGRNGLITAREAAELLDVGVRQVHLYTRSGILAAYHPEGSKLGHPQLYQVEEVMAWVKHRSEKLNIRKVYATAVRAEAIAQSNRRELERLRVMVGYNIGPREYDEAAVKELCLEAEDAVENPPTEAIELVKWSKVFFSIYQEFFQLAELYTDNPQPWRSFLTLGEVVQKNCPIGQLSYDKELEAAYGYFGAARRHLGFSVHIFITGREDLTAANKVTPGAETNIYERLLSHVHLPTLDQQDPDTH